MHNLNQKLRESLQYDKKLTTLVTYNVNKLRRDGLSTKMATRLAMNDGTNEMVRKLKLPMIALSKKTQ